jgi:uncharacterized protein (TIGR00725 family)
MLQIGVIGAEKAKDGEKKIAKEVGMEIGRAGHLLICGGRGGIMEAAAKGVKSRGGLSVGILPGETKKEANQYIDVAIVTAMSHARNAIIARTADVLLAVGGGAGTLSEIALALKIGKPVILLKDAMPRFSPKSKETYVASSPKEAVKLAEKITLNDQEASE